MPYTLKQLQVEFDNLSAALEEMTVRESAIEHDLVAGVETLGGVCEKFVTPGRRGPPDRIITWPPESKGYDWALRDALIQAGADTRQAGVLRLPVVEFVETKVDGDKPEPWQLRDHVRRRQWGHVVHVITGKRQVRKYLQERGAA